MNVDLNEIIISGTINNVMDNNQDYIKFGLTTLKYDKRKVFSSLNINRHLYEIFLLEELKYLLKVILILILLIIK